MTWPAPDPRNRTLGWPPEVLATIKSVSMTRDWSGFSDSTIISTARLDQVIPYGEKR